MNKSTLDNIDFGIATLLKADLPEKALRFLEELLLLHTGTLTIKVFDSAASEILRNRTLLSKVATRWFLNGARVLCSYTELLEHPKSRDDDYRKNATSGSILYPVIALWAALLQDEELYGEVSRVQELMQHCTYQLWYPDERSEDHFYKNSDAHGAVLANLALNTSVGEFLAQVFGECEETKHFEELSEVKYGWWPLIIVACRHYRLPLPLHLLSGLRHPASRRDE